MVTADHGEELFDHGGLGHASTTLDSPLYEELLHIPLWLRLPDGRGAGSRPGLRFQQVDLLPTLAPLVGVELPPAAPGVPLDGRDLRALLAEGLGGDPAVEAHPDAWAAAAPCGWQCPPERRGERVSTWLPADGLQEHCRAPGPCRPPLDALWREALERAARLGSPVASP